MKAIPAFSLHAAAVAATLFATSLAFSNESTPARDDAAERLAAIGVIPVKLAGPYVENGTFRIQVSTKLGRPSSILSDGTWLYDNRTIEQSNAHGTLVVRFHQGRVSELALVAPAVAAAMRTDPNKALGSYLVATK